ncbi:MAG: type II toxin-antitoxin system prevent-host-death family antitoxin [Solirubrobacterales bacterium]|nr:MAG: type II toxin-antitoxin system prevent-host-death family antitoxin [Solirubrobacterales bacterium]
MTQVNVHEAKTHLSKLLERVESGEEIVIARAGKPVARLVKHEPARLEPRRPGSARGKIVIHDNFDDPLPDDIARGFGMID